MKNWITLLIASLFTLPALADHHGGGDSSKYRYGVDTEESYVRWEGTRVGGGHDGRIMVKEGHLNLRERNLLGGEFVVDMNSIIVDDIKDESRNARLRNHLLSDDFFSVEKHPEAKIVVRDAQFGKGGVYNIVADLTIMGETHPVAFDAKIEENDGVVTAEADFSIDRTKWGVRYRSGSFFEALGDRMIHDDIKFGVRLSAKKK